jgi:hypothetical protein
MLDYSNLAILMDIPTDIDSMIINNLIYIIHNS